MDIYQIIITHNRIWTMKEMLCFGGVFLIILAGGIIMVYRQRILKRQAAAVLFLVGFLGIVFGSTVFTRTVTVRSYELIPFWSWREVIVRQDRYLLVENLLNCVLLMPMGVLLPFIANRRIKWRWAFLTGFCVAVVIEVCQLVFCVGLFEWDDMIHNGIGCLIGCLIGNVGMRIVERR